MIPKSGLLTLLFSFIPGAGQMYQGYMKRGLCHIILFVLFFVPGTITWGLESLMLGSAVVYMYSFFDSINLRGQIKAGIAPADEFFLARALTPQITRRILGQYNRILGWGLVIVGVYSLYNILLVSSLSSLVDRLSRTFPSMTDVFWEINHLVRSLPSVFVAAVLVYVGVRLIRGSKRTPPDQLPEDYTQFKGEE